MIQAVRGLEERLRIRLLTRTTRTVAPTAAGERLANAIGNRFDEIEAELDALTELRDKPAGTVRITCGDHVLRAVLLPKLTPVLRDDPDITLELDVSYGFRDIVADRFDAGVRLGRTIAKDMIAVPIGPAPAHGRGGITRLFQAPFAAQDTARLDGSLLHQPAHAHLGRVVGLGFREEGTQGQRPRRRAADLQHHATAGGRGTRRLGDHFLAGG